MFTDPSGEQLPDKGLGGYSGGGNNTGNYSTNYYYSNNNWFGNQNQGLAGGFVGYGNVNSAGGYTNYNNAFAGGYGGGYSGEGNYGALVFGVLNYLLNPSSRQDPSRFSAKPIGSPTPYSGTAAKPLTLAKPVGSGASTVYAGGGKRQRGSMSASTNSFIDIASNVNNTSSIVGVTSDISKAAGFNSTVGIWNGLSKVQYYSSGWSGRNQYVWKTFGIAKGVSNVTMVVGFASDFYLSSTINPETNIPYQTWEETGLNSVVSLVVLRAGWWGIPIQMNYMLAKPYFKAIKEHPDWVTYPYRPR